MPEDSRIQDSAEGPTTARGAGRGSRPRRPADAPEPSAPAGPADHLTPVASDDHDSAVGCLHYRLSICGCDCWFCPDCCGVKGYKLRARLIPVLETFTSIMMLTLTVDPLLFASPLAAYRYIRDRRCVARSMQDLRRAGFLHSGRYFYVVEWQTKTQQVHYHLLCDATFVPWAAVLESWSKHRPAGAGQIIGNRPAFGTVLISMPRFKGGPIHAARYATKYLVKTPAEGFPAWVMEEGRAKRIKRYGVSRGFWPREHDGDVPTSKREGKPKRERSGQSYACERSCKTDSLTIIEI